MFEPCTIMRVLTTEATWCCRQGALALPDAAGERSPAALDGRRVVVQLRTDTDPETGGSYTLKRWRVAKIGRDGGAAEIELRPDNPVFKPLHIRQEDGLIRVIAEFLEVL